MVAEVCALLRVFQEKNNESTDDIVIKIAKHLNININEKDVDISHRTSTKDDAVIIVKFDSRKSKKPLLRREKEDERNTNENKGLGI